MIIIEKAYKLRLYPNKRQKDLISKTFGCARYVYNYFLNRRIELYKTENKSLGFTECSRELTILKKEMEWLKEPDKFALQNSLKHLDNAYKRFFKENAGFPKFKSKKNNSKSYKTQFSNNNIEFKGNKIKLPKLGFVRCRGYKTIKGRMLNVTISQAPSGDYYASICCTDVDIKPYELQGSKVGIDLGLKNFCITSDGEFVENPKYLKKSLEKLVKLQRELSRKSIGSSNGNKARLKVARIHQKIANQRYDFLQKLSTRLVKEYDIICVEDLSIKNMAKNDKLAQSISDVSWSEFIRQLQYKSDWYGKKIIKIDRYFPSSQICNNCGCINSEIKDLFIREWVCSECGTHHDRDINASINILKEGLKQVA